MRTTLAALVCLSLAACGGAQEKPKTETAPEPKKLGVGDAAPPLVVSKWLSGSPVKAFEPGKVYVVEFWATWCGPCISAMPHLAGLQADYKSQGLVVVGFTNKDENGNTPEKVEKFVEKRGKKLGYAFAYSANEETWNAYMEASGQQGIPCSFVVDKAGKIAFIGHPMELDEVLPKVLDGTWRGEADLKEIKAADEELRKVFGGLEKDPAGVLTALAAYAKKYPNKAKQDVFQLRTVIVLLKAKKLDEAKTTTEALLKKASEREDGSLLGNVAAIWSSPELNPEKKNLDLASKAAETLLKVGGDDDIQAFLTAAEVYKTLGQKDKAIGLVEQAIKATDDLRLKARLSEIVKGYKEEK